MIWTEFRVEEEEVSMARMTAWILKQITGACDTERAWRPAWPLIC